MHTGIHALTAGGAFTHRFRLLELAKLTVVSLNEAVLIRARVTAGNDANEHGKPSHGGALYRRCPEVASIKSARRVTEAGRSSVGDFTLYSGLAV